MRKFIVCFYLLNSCGSYEYGQLNGEGSDWNELKDKIYIMGIHGRAAVPRELGEKDYWDTGMSVLIDRLKHRLERFDIPDENFVKVMWNPDYQSSSKLPDVDYIESHMPLDYKKEPAYTGIVGHSFGGYAAGLVSEAYFERLGQGVDYIGTVDAVFGPRNDEYVDYFGKYTHNWYQTNGVDFVNYACPIIRECRVDGFVSCGNDMEEMGFDSSERLNTQHDGSGAVKMGSCLGRSSRKQQAHVTIDQDGFVHLGVLGKIEEDIQRIYDESTNY